MNDKIFSGLEDLGFENIKNIDLYNKNNEEKKEVKKEEPPNEDKIKSLLYDREIACPVCGFISKTKCIKMNAYRMGSKDTDFFIRYTLINPYFYDVWICNHCGYAAMKSDFSKINKYQCEEVVKQITPKWNKRTYPDIFDANIAIERYKLALLSSYVIGAKSSRKAINCLKIAWMYRILDDKENENLFMIQALEGFESAYFDEDFPIYGMDKFSLMYLIGELNKRLGNNSAALSWFSKVLTSTSASQKIKDIAREQKDAIREEDKHNTENFSFEDSSIPKKGFFSKFFK